MARRHSPRLHPQLHASEYGAGVRARRRTSPASMPDSEDMLWEILLRLPPQPSSLARASGVCKRWRGLVTDPRFLHRFRAHHRKPPLLGLFESFDQIALSWRFRSIRAFLNRFRSFDRRIEFCSVLEPPDHCMPLHDIVIHSGTQLLGCRHGLAVLMGTAQEEILVCDPITGEHHRVDTPREFRSYLYLNVAVLCAATDQGHVHGSCHSSPFKVVLMSPLGEDHQPVVCVYSSETRVWGNIISTVAHCGLRAANTGILVGNVLYWSSRSVSTCASPLNLKLTNDIIEFDLDRQSLAVIKGPPDLNGSLVHQIIQTEDAVVGLAVLSQGRFKIWERKVNRHGGVTWLLQKTIEMHTILKLPAQIERSVAILGYDEVNGVIFFYVDANVYMVQLISMQSNKLHESNSAYRCYPFTSFYAPGIVGGYDEAEILPLA